MITAFTYNRARLLQIQHLKFKNKINNKAKLTQKLKWNLFIQRVYIFIPAASSLPSTTKQTNKQKLKSHTQTQQISLTKLSLISDLQSWRYATNNSLYKQSESVENGMFQYKQKERSALEGHYRRFQNKENVFQKQKREK